MKTRLKAKKPSGKLLNEVAAEVGLAGLNNIAFGRGDILRLAAASQLDPRTVKRALERGVRKMQSEVDRGRLRTAAKELGIVIE